MIRAEMVTKYDKDTTTHPIIDPNIWVLAIGEPQKGEIIWIRDGEHAIVILGTHASSSTSTSHRRQELIRSPPTPNTEKIESLIHRRTEESVPLLPRIIA